MTFTQNIKNEVLKIKNEKKCCRDSMLYGMLLFSARFENENLLFTTENQETAKKFSKLLLENIDGNKCEISDANDNGIREYKISCKEAEEISKLTNTFGYADGGSTYKILLENFRCESCRAAFLRGVFLACASVISPDSGYHLEFVVSRFNLSRDLLRLLKICSYNAKYTKRNSHYIIYFKESEAIVDFLAQIGATKCSFEMTNLIIEKDIRNNCNRIANCEAANIKRTVSTAQKQIDAINGLIACGKFSNLTQELQETAKIRLENVDMSLLELSQLHSPQVTKSCVNHRLSKICEIWEETVK